MTASSRKLCIPISYFFLQCGPANKKELLLFKIKEGYIDKKIHLPEKFRRKNIVKLGVPEALLKSKKDIDFSKQNSIIILGFLSLYLEFRKNKH